MCRFVTRGAAWAAALVLALLAPLLAAPPSMAAPAGPKPTWTPVVDLGAGTDYPEIDSNARGDTAVAYLTGEGIVVRSHKAGGSWSEPTTVFAGSTSSSFSVGIDGRGRVTVVELRTVGDNTAAIFARSRTSSGWSPAKQISKVAGYLGGPLLEVASSGAAVVAFVTDAVGAEDRVHAVYRASSGAGWSAPKVLSAADVALARALIDRKGQATVAWRRRTGSGDVLEARSFRASGAFGPVVTLAKGTGSVGGLWVAGNDAGEVAVAWVSSPPSSSARQLRIRTRKPGGAFSAPKTLLSSNDTGGAGLSYVEVAVAADGRVITAWARQESAPTYRVQSRQRGAGRAWSATRTIYSGSAAIANLFVQPTAGKGTAFVWLQNEDGSGEVYSRLLSGAGSLSPKRHVIHSYNLGVPVESSGAGDVVVGVRPEDNRVRVRVLDSAGPMARLRQPTARFTTSRKVRGAWSALDAWSRVSSYTISRRTAKLGGGFQRREAWTTSMRSKSFTGIPGSTYCLKVRAKDRVGNYGAATAERCVAVPLDDGGLAASPGWTKATSKRNYLGTITQTTTKGQTLSKSVKTRRLALIAAKCPSCGSVQVFLGKTRLGTFSLKGGARQRVLIPVKTFGSLRSGKVRIVVVSAGKKVVIDGLATSQR